MSVPGAAVVCYSGYTYAQEPRVVLWYGGRYPVARINHRWRTENGPAFRVEAEGGKIFDLHYCERDGCWEVLLLTDSDRAGLLVPVGGPGDP